MSKVGHKQWDHCTGVGCVDAIGLTCGGKDVSDTGG